MARTADVVLESMFSRVEPHLADSAFNLKQNIDGELQNVPSLNEFCHEVLEKPRLQLLIRILSEVLYQLGECDCSVFTERPGEPLFCWNHDQDHIEVIQNFIKEDDLTVGEPIPVAECKPRSEDITMAATVLLYVKAYIHPRWVIKTELVDRGGEKCTTFMVNTWNSHRDDMGRGTTGYKALVQHIKDGILYAKISENGERIHVSIDSNGAKQRLEFYPDYQTDINFLREIPKIPEIPEDGSEIPKIPKGGSKPVPEWPELEQGTRISSEPATLISPLPERDDPDYEQQRLLLSNYLDEDVVTDDEEDYTRDGLMHPDNRPVCFFGPFDLTVTQERECFLNSTHNMLEDFNEYSDYTLYDQWAEANGKNNYEDFIKTGLVTVAEETAFVNEAGRFAGGEYNEGYVEGVEANERWNSIPAETCHLLFATGFRGEIPGTPEHVHLIPNGRVFDVSKYEMRCRLITESIFRFVEGHHGGGKDSKTIAFTGLGLGVWAHDDSIQKPIMLKVISEVFEKYRKRTGGKIHGRFLFDGPNSDLKCRRRLLNVDTCKTTLESLREELDGAGKDEQKGRRLLIERAGRKLELAEGELKYNVVPRQEPGVFVKREKDSYVYFVFAGDANSHRGNEGLIGFNSMSGDPQYVINSRLPCSW